MAVQPLVQPRSALMKTRTKRGALCIADNFHIMTFDRNWVIVSLALRLLSVKFVA